MRTTLDIDDDVLQAAKELARRRKRTAGQVLSELARLGLTGPGRSSPGAPVADPPDDVLGFRPFPCRGGLLTNELIDRMREDEDD